ncbi:MAG: cell division protein [Sphingobium sp.]|nr:cell division protein [Sphingobium sp.]
MAAVKQTGRFRMLRWLGDDRAAASARRRLLPEGRLAGPMPWIIAIMMFLTILAAALAMAMGQARGALGSALAGRVTIQIIDADPQARNVQTQTLDGRLRNIGWIAAVHVVPETELAEQLRPWLGGDPAEADLPIPALIDVDLASGVGGDRRAELSRIVKGVAPSARVQAHADFLSPLLSMLASLGWLSIAIVVLMVLATGAVVVLAARSAHATHRGTIETLHMMGATDVQIARLFQRRIALDALLGSLAGFTLAVPVLLLLAQRAGALDSGLIGAAALPPLAWPALALFPLGAVLVAAGAARFTVLRALGQTL